MDFNEINCCGAIILHFTVEIGIAQAALPFIN